MKAKIAPKKDPNKYRLELSILEIVTFGVSCFSLGFSLMALISKFI